MEEHPGRRGPSLLTYVLVVALMLAVVIGIMILIERTNDPCNGCTGEGCGSVCWHIQNAL